MFFHQFLILSKCCDIEKLLIRQIEIINEKFKKVKNIEGVLSTTKYLFQIMRNSNVCVCGLITSRLYLYNLI